MRLRATHQATVFGEKVVDTSELNKDLTENTNPVLTAPVRFNDVSRTFVRTPRGEHVTQKPRIWFPPYGDDPATGDQVVSADRIETNMDVSLESRDWTVDETDRFSIEEVNVNRRRGGRPERVECELQYHE
jgi:hypothetical protein